MFEKLGGVRIVGVVLVVVRVGDDLIGSFCVCCRGWGLGIEGVGIGGLFIVCVGYLVSYVYFLGGEFGRREGGILCK